MFHKLNVVWHDMVNNGPIRLKFGKHISEIPFKFGFTTKSINAISASGKS